VLLFAGAVTATIVGSIASFVAGIPELIKAWKNPSNVSQPMAILLIGANVFIILATVDQSFINVVYPASWAAYWILSFALSLRK
jgi:hypothetical protein